MNSRLIISYASVATSCDLHLTFYKRLYEASFTSCLLHYILPYSYIRLVSQFQYSASSLRKNYYYLIIIYYSLLVIYLPICLLYCTFITILFWTNHHTYFHALILYGILGLRYSIAYDIDLTKLRLRI